MQAAVSFMLAPGEIMVAAAKLRAVEWAAALDKSSSMGPHCPVGLTGPHRLDLWITVFWRGSPIIGERG